jgi:hypothetical protein
VALGLSQTLEAKGRPEPGDTLGTDNPSIRKYRLLSVTTSPIAYDFEQAKLPGRTGWVTPQISNTILSDLVPGLNLSITHDLWRGVVGTDTADFDPFLSRVDAGFSISSNTFRGIASLLGLGGPRERETGRSPDRNLPGRDAEGRLTDRFGAETEFTGRVPFSQRRPEMMGGQGFQAQVRYSLQRFRPLETTVPGAVERETQQSIQLNTQFAPTRFWRVGWSTQYNVADKRFESHSFDLERDLHEWRARFSFVQNPNGNNAFFFSIWLTDLPDLKLDINNNSLGG